MICIIQNYEEPTILKVYKLNYVIVPGILAMESAVVACMENSLRFRSVANFVLSLTKPLVL